jgi:hypothetical protein
MVSSHRHVEVTPTWSYTNTYTLHIQLHIHRICRQTRNYVHMHSDINVIKLFLDPRKSATTFSSIIFVNLMYNIEYCKYMKNVGRFTHSPLLPGFGMLHTTHGRVQ